MQRHERVWKYRWGSFLWNKEHFQNEKKFSWTMAKRLKKLKKNTKYCSNELEKGKFLYRIIRIIRNIFKKTIFFFSEQTFKKLSVFFYFKNNFTERKVWNWVFVTNVDFLIPIFFLPDGVNLWYFKLKFFQLTEFIVWNI